MKAKLDKIHQASMRILSEAGIRLHLPEAVKMFADRGQRVDGDRVFPTEKFLLEQIANAPESFVLKAKNPQYDMDLGGQNRHYAAGYGCPSIIEANGTVRDALMADYVNFLKMVEQSPFFKINGGILAQPNDVTPALSTPAMIYATLRHTEKCIFGVPGSREEMNRTMDMAAIAWGGEARFADSPKVMTMISTLSPLQMDKMALESILVAAARGQALMISPGPMAGATGPVTLAGNIALGNAECLVGLALAQMAKPGTAVMYGLQATTSDLRTGSIAIGTPGYPLQAKYCKAMATYYKLPCRCGGGVNDAKEVSAQSGYEAVLPIFTAAENGVNLIVHSAGILDSWAAISYEKFMCDLDIISMTEYYLNDIEVNDDTLAVEVITEVGPGGIYLTQPHTMKRCRTVPWLPKVAHRGSLGGAKMADKLLANAGKAKDGLIESYKAPDFAPDAARDLDAYMVKLGAEPAWLETIKPSK